LFKIGARLRQTACCIRVHLATGWSWPSLFREPALGLNTAPPLPLHNPSASAFRMEENSAIRLEKEQILSFHELSELESIVQSTNVLHEPIETATTCQGTDTAIRFGATFLGSDGHGVSTTCKFLPYRAERIVCHIWLSRNYFAVLRRTKEFLT
jgi:hypothetical protein